MNYKGLIAQRISELIDLDKESVEKIIETPPNSEMGDFAFPCFKLAKVLRKAPNDIASDLKEKFNGGGFDRVENIGPYLNFFVDKGVFNKSTIERILREGDSYGASNLGNRDTVCVEFSSPNVAKLFHVGYLFTTVIGNALYKIYNNQGYKAVGINHIGDWGTQFGKLISAYKRWINEEDLEKEPIKELLRIYTKFHNEAEKDKDLEDEGRMWFKKLEDGDAEATELWERFTKLSLKEFNRVYDELGIKFDSFAGEYFYNNKMSVVIEELKEKNLLTDSNGAKVVMLEDHNMPPCIILKSDGADIYATRDLAAAIYRKKTYNFKKNIYVVGSQQALHFKQVFKTLELAGHEWAEDCIHVGFGLVKFLDRKCSTSKGEVILLEDLLKEAKDRALEVIKEKNPTLEDKEEVAAKIGIGSIVFTCLKNSREKDVMFDWEEILSFEGETAPYVQYSYARAKSIIRKVQKLQGDADYTKLNSKEEFELIKTLEAFNKNIINALDKLEPSIVTMYAIEVAKAFNKFYNAHTVVNLEDNNLKAARVNLVIATCQIIKNALYLLGIQVVEKM